MGDIGDRIRTRFLPALLTASGVTLLAAGLLSYTQPVTAEPALTPAPATTSPTASPTPTPLITLPPLGSAAPPSATPTADPDRAATRVRIAALDIDLPVIQHTTRSVPCDVALFPDLDQFEPPGFGRRATYLYAHARTGMFLPLLERSKVKDGRGMLGMVIEVWTSDDYRFLYEIVEVRRHVRPEAGYDDPFAATREELWLQTSEGPGVPAGQPRNPLLQIVALPLSVERADPADAHPKAKPVDCS